MQVEVKAAAGRLPKSVAESVSALANRWGGTVILGLSEKNGFAPAAGFDARPALDALTAACGDKALAVRSS